MTQRDAPINYKSMVRRIFSLNTTSKKALLFFVIFYVVFGVWLTVFQEEIIYMPFAQDFKNCPAFSSAEAIQFGTTRAYYKMVGENLAVLYHGNAGSACDRDYWATIFERSGYSYLIVEYTGYSSDENRPSHAGIKENVRDVVAFISSHQFTHVLVVGESIGSGPASFHASLLPPEKLLLVSAFSDLKELGESIYWFYPASLMVKNAFDNVTLLQEYRGDVLVVHGKNDTVIPEKIGRTLFAGINSDSKGFISIAGAGHNDIFSFPDTTTAMYGFLR